ncbi:MAG: FHA domain-containing protein [Gammaproteobacteria bacterium]
MNNNNNIDNQLKASSGIESSPLSDEEQPARPNEKLPAANSERRDEDAAAQEADQSHEPGSAHQCKSRADRVTALVATLSSQTSAKSDTTSEEEHSRLGSGTRKLKILVPQLENPVTEGTRENADTRARMDGSDDHLQSLNDQTGKLDGMLDSLTDTHTWVTELGTSLIEDLNACNELAVNMQAHEEQLVELEALVDRICGGDESSVNAVEAKSIIVNELETFTDTHTVNRLLIALNGDHVIKYPLYKNIVTIGRGPFNDIQIRTQFVSRSHARIVTNSAGAIIEDMNSKNGISVNGRRTQQWRLKNGDVIDVGKINFKFIDLMDDDAGEGTA